MSRPPELLRAIVTRRWIEAKDILGLELKAAGDAALPPFTAGSHLDLYLPNGLVRQYSLCNDPSEQQRYELGIALAQQSRGGSSYLHANLQVGQSLQISAPRNNFPLVRDAAQLLFVAGGIGITPILSMIRHAETRGISWRLLYCVRHRERLPYQAFLGKFGDRVKLHIDTEAMGTKADLQGFLAEAPSDAHIYVCGPAGLMDAVAGLTVDRPPGQVHFERFSAAPAAVETDDRAFHLRLARSGMELRVDAGVSILEALESAGIPHPFSCREGLCRSCEAPMLAGEADHRDCVLSDAERDAHRSIMVCVSRAKTEVLELDL